MSIFVNKNGQQLGPFSEAEISAKLAAGEITPQDYVWWEGQTDWKPLEQTALGGTAPLSTAPPVAAAPIAPSAPGKTPGLAIWALVFGILGFFCSIFAGIPAIIMGHVSLGRIRRNPALGGHGIALAGTILGYISLVLLPFVAVVAISVLIALGNQVKTVNEQITEKLQEAQTNSAPSSDNSTTNSTTTNNAPPTGQ